jgi:hypothetical protein
MRIPEFLIWLGAGKRQVGATYFNLCLGACMFQVFILGVSAMNH